MVRRIVPLLLTFAALAACQPQRGPRKTGAAVARGEGVVITVDEYKARLKEQAPIIRSRFTTLERKKEFLDGLVRFEVLAAEAERQGLADDPDVQSAVRKLMVQKLVQKRFADAANTKDVPDDELRAYYERNRAEYYRPERLRIAAVTFRAAPGTPERTGKLAAARKAAAEIRTAALKNPLEFGRLAQKYSEDEATRAIGGELGFKSREELAKAYGETFAAAVWGMKDGEISGVLESSQGLHVVRVAGRQEELDRPFDQIKEQLAGRYQRERKQKDLEAWVQKLKDQARVRVDDAALDKIQVEAEASVPPQGFGAMGGMPPMMPPRPMAPPPGAPPVPPPAPTAR